MISGLIFLRVRYGILNVQGRILVEANRGDGQARKVNILVPNCWIMAAAGIQIEACPQHLGKFFHLYTTSMLYQMPQQHSKSAALASSLVPPLISSSIIGLRRGPH